MTSCFYGRSCEWVESGSNANPGPGGSRVSVLLPDGSPHAPQEEPEWSVAPGAPTYTENSRIRRFGTKAGWYVALFEHGQLVRSGEALDFWYHPDAARIYLVPLWRREAEVELLELTEDHYALHLSWNVHYRIRDPRLTTDRIDFSVSLDTGKWRTDPMHAMAVLLRHRFKVAASTALSRMPLSGVQGQRGWEWLDESIFDALNCDLVLREVGVKIVAAALTKLKLDRADPHRPPGKGPFWRWAS